LYPNALTCSITILAPIVPATLQKREHALDFGWSNLHIFTLDFSWVRSPWVLAKRLLRLAYHPDVPSELPSESPNVAQERLTMLLGESASGEAKALVLRRYQETQNEYIRIGVMRGRECGGAEDKNLEFGMGPPT
jgi:hypothetical protein